MMVSSISLEQAARRKPFPENMAQVPHAMGGFRSGINCAFKRMIVKLLEVYHIRMGINRAWQFINSISIKSLFGGPKQQETI